ncbi:MAG: hypothetical protein HFI42_10215 [Lachnospiraceae bacterium]|nr:hypothetical protein [Lachnospiraceae bacterium]
MKLNELKRKFHDRYVIRVIAGVLTIVLLGSSMGIYSYTVQAQQGTEAPGKAELPGDEEAVLTEVLSGQAASGGRDAGREETVYVVADAAGKTKEVIVSEWLKNPERKDVLEDATDLKDIKNVKGDETFSQGADGTLTWQAEGKDIYYQGTTDKELPVEVNISYRLDGKEMEPQELAGKSGKVVIRMDYTNRETVQAEINGQKEDISIPFTAVSGMVLSDKFRNVEVTNGKVISDGKNQIVVGVAMPGLAESLQVDREELAPELEIPSYIEVTADVEDFSLNMTMTMIMSDILTELDLGDGLDLSDLGEDIDTLSDASLQLVDGSARLKDGTGTLSEKSGELQSGVNRLSEGIGAYVGGVGQVAGGIASLKEKSGALGSGAMELESGMNAIAGKFTEEGGLLDGSASLKDGAAQVSQGADQLYAGIQGMQQAIGGPLSGEQITELQQQAQAAVDASFANGGGAQIMGQFAADPQVTAMKNTLVAALCAQNGITDDAGRAMIEAQVNAQMEGLLSGVVSACQQSARQAAGEAVVSGAQGAKDQIAAQLEAAGLAENVGTLAAGAKQVSDGAARLSAGTYTLYEEGIQKLQSGIQGLAGSVPALLEGINTLYEGGNTLVEKSGELTNGAGTLSKGTGALIGGIKELDQGAGTLQDGMEEFNQDGIQKLTELYHGDVQSLLARMDAVKEAGSSYRTFTKLPGQMKGTVKFVIRTEAIQ